MAIYLSRKKSGVVPTSITPSNSSPVALTANTAVEPTTSGYAIESYTNATPEVYPQSISQGGIYKFARSGQYIQGISYITPSNVSPVQMNINGAYYIQTNGGYAIKSYSSITPSNSNPVGLSSGSIYKMGGSGKAVESITNVTPSSTPVSVSTNDVVKIGGSGVIVDSVPTPTSITPSNSSPVALTANTPVNPSASGYAISSYTNRTPSTTNRSYTSLPTDTINRIQTRTGYLYGAIPTGRNLFSATGTCAYSTSWTKLTLIDTAYDSSGESATIILDPEFGAIQSDGTIKITRAITTAYIAGQAFYGRSSSGSTTYAGLRLLKNGSVISGTEIFGSSSTVSPSFRRVSTSFAVGDIITVQTKSSSSSTSPVRFSVNITTA